MPLWQKYQWSQLLYKLLEGLTWSQKTLEIDSDILGEFSQSARITKNRYCICSKITAIFIYAALVNVTVIIPWTSRKSVCLIPVIHSYNTRLSHNKKAINNSLYFVKFICKILFLQFN